eukprot:CAMPEP_0185599536 /NCGR_PEP_ID=MMETSP0434-20130131/82776_1 /TAXON_ID=626734 ORGANISM="Favella taraikaensis, Strain Fe Narragansett Bay" /NCGR_SAMPLE_ID=MMETSP0434 /ASSEMBLY_ACC=CAM_ASM_000379 /LENGTH=61 /DNA_ID=CAMNT_0028228985 /DNA_START=524 /DNA_END=709 /DNA_ORIENTATION=+
MTTTTEHDVAGNRTPNHDHGKSASEEHLMHSATTGVVMLGATSTMPINEGDIVLDSARLDK